MWTKILWVRQSGAAFWSQLRVVLLIFLRVGTQLESERAYWLIAITVQCMCKYRFIGWGGGDRMGHFAWRLQMAKCPIPAPRPNKTAYLGRFSIEWALLFCQAVQLACLPNHRPSPFLLAWDPTRHSTEGMFQMRQVLFCNWRALGKAQLPHPAMPNWQHSIVAQRHFHLAPLTPPPPFVRKSDL